MRVNRAPGPRFLAAATALAVVLITGGCSGDEEPEASPPESLVEPGDAPTLTVEPVTSSGRVVGRVPRKERVRVDRAVSGVAVRWLDAAYLAGDYPRRHFRNSFAVFTTGARAAARQDLGRLTNARIGSRIDGVTPTRIKVRVDLLAVRGRAVTGTAHVDARFRTDGDLERAFHVGGRLMMTRQHHHWRVFAYDVARDRVDGGPHAKQGHGNRGKHGSNGKHGHGDRGKHGSHGKHGKNGDRA